MNTPLDAPRLKTRLWHLSLFGTRLGLAALLSGYLWVSTQGAIGGIGVMGLGITGFIYLLSSACVALMGRGRELSPKLQTLQTILDNAALALVIPHDPSVVLPTLFFLVFNPLEFVARYGSRTYRFGLLCTALACVAIVTARGVWLTPALGLEAWFVMGFVWSGILYGLVNLHNVTLLRNSLEESQADLRHNLAAMGAAAWQAYPDQNSIHFQGAINTLLKRSDNSPLTRLSDILEYVHEDDRKLFNTKLIRSYKHGTETDFSYRMRPGKTGRPRWHRVITQPLDGHAGTHTGIRGIVFDDHERIESERKLEKLRRQHDLSLRVANVGGWTWYVAQRRIAVDIHLENVYGIEPGSFDGRQETWLSYIHPQEREAVGNILLDCLKNGKAFETTYRVQQADASIRWIKIRGEPTQVDSDGSIQRVSGAAWDVTQAVLAREQVEATRKRYETALRGVGITVWSYFPQAKRFEADSNVVDVVGMPKDQWDASFQGLIDAVHPADKNRVRDSVNRSAEFGTSLILRYRRIFPDESIHWTESRAEAYRDEQGNVTHLSGVAWDVTQEVEAQTAIESALAKLDAATQAANIGFWQIDAQTLAFDPDISWRRVVGYPLDAPAPSLEQALAPIHPDDQEGFTQSVYQMLEQGKIIDHQYRINRMDDGEARHMLTHASPLRDDNGQIISYAGFVMDQTEAAQQRQRLARLQQRYNHSMLMARIGNWTIFLDTQTAEFDKTTARLLGITGQIVNVSLKTLCSYFVEDDHPKLQAIFTAGSAQEATQEVHLRRIMPDGQLRWFCVRGAGVETERNQPLQMTGAVWDITELAELNDALMRSNRELDDFAYIASHDLREPLRGLHNYAQFLQEDYADKIDEEGQRMLSALGRLAQRLDNLMRDLLHFSRVGRAELAVQATDLNTVLQDVVTTLEFSLNEKNIELRIPKALPTVECDSVRVGELLRNLITNAAKYNDKTKKWIEVGHQDGVFYVGDNGIGIAEEHQERVFAIFKRLHTRDEYGGGTGAGLSIAKHIAERHGGKLWLTSTLGEGTTFYFTLAKQL